MTRRARLAAAALTLAALLVSPASALAITDDELAQLDQAPDASTGSVAETGASSGARVFVGLVIVLGIIWALYKVVRRAQRGRLGEVGGDGAMEVLSTTHLAPNRVLHLVRVGEEVLLVGATDHGISTLHHVPGDDPIIAALAEQATARAGEPRPRAKAASGSPVPLRVSDALRDLTAR